MYIEPDIHISFQYVGYSEGSNTLELDIDRGKSDAFLYVPSDDEWNKRYEWAKGRKEKIIATILEYLREKDPTYPILIEEY